jgi:DNA repair photolyase
VRRVFEPHCAPIEDCWRTIETLQKAGIETSVAVAPILPSDPEALIAICHRYGWSEWLDPAFQQSIIARMAAAARFSGRDFDHGPRGFGLLALPGNIDRGIGVL